MTRTVGHAWSWAKRQWDRWKITVLFVGLVAVALSVVYVDNVQNARRVETACASVTQVKNAALELTGRISTNGVTDPVTLERIRVMNKARAEAQRKLELRLACR